jgi:release factor glutamine methyltransferase
LKDRIYTYLLQKLQETHDLREAQQQARLLAEHIEQSLELNSKEDSWQNLTDKVLQRLNEGEPIQYVIGHTWFYTLKLELNHHVLVPRPETEELVHWLLYDYHKGLITSAPSIADLGTGSGCIALAISRQIPKAIITAIDISEEALMLATLNAQSNNLGVAFKRLDILTEPLPGKFDVLISNPPYVSKKEFSDLSPSVRDYEPRIALTPMDDDALIFYRRIAELGKAHLKPNGRIYVELNEFHSREIREIFMQEGYLTDMRQDMQGKWRMLCAIPGL